MPKNVVAWLVDDSGSMLPKRDDTIGTIRTLSAELAKKAPESVLLFARFNSELPGMLQTVVSETAQAAGNLISEKKDSEIVSPSGMTPLLDAIGKFIIQIESVASDKDDKVLFVIITDGEENNSREFSKSQVVESLRQKNLSGWQTQYIGADLNRFAEADAQAFARGTQCVYYSTHGVDDYHNSVRGLSAMCVNFAITSSVDKKR